MAELEDMGLRSPHEHIKNASLKKCMWNNSHGKPIGNWQKNSHTKRLQERFPHNWVAWEKKHQLGTCTPRRGLGGKERPHRHTPGLGGELQTGHPCPGSYVEETRPLPAGENAGRDRRYGEA